jgi:hypothetical protein
MEQKCLKKKKRNGAIKKALLKIIREATDSRQKKLNFANFANLSVSGVDSFIYEGRGSFETWMNAFLYRFNLDAQMVAYKIPLLVERLRQPVSETETEADRLWRELSVRLSEHEKVQYLKLIKLNCDVMEMRNKKEIP